MGTSPAPRTQHECSTLRTPPPQVTLQGLVRTRSTAAVALVASSGAVSGRLDVIGQNTTHLRSRGGA
jgi:hypothetical protein